VPKIHLQQVVRVTTLLSLRSCRHSIAAKDEVDSHGPILSKYPGTIFALRQWKNRYWAKVGPSSIFLFKNKIEFYAWSQSKSKDTIRNAMFVRKEIHFDLVKLLLRKKEYTQPICKYMMRDVAVNRTKKGGKTPMDGCSFKLQMETDAGIFEAAVFSSQDASQEVDTLHAAIKECMEACI
jgi:hypothetical protein